MSFLTNVYTLYFYTLVNYWCKGNENGLMALNMKGWSNSVIKKFKLKLSQTITLTYQIGKNPSLLTHSTDGDGGAEWEQLQGLYECKLLMERSLYCILLMESYNTSKSI